MKPQEDENEERPLQSAQEAPGNHQDASYHRGITSEQVDRFSDLFVGLDTCYGTDEGGCVHEAPLPKHHRGHLDGSGPGIGIYPLVDDHCRWATADIDVDDRAGAAAVQAALRTLGVDSTVFTSRARGFHVTVFFGEFVPARNARRLLRWAIRQAGLPPETEVFPKQDTLRDGQVGNYLRLPYPGRAEPGRRVAVDPSDSWRPLTLAEFLERVDRAPLETLNAALAEIGEDEPPATAGCGAVRPRPLDPRTARAEAAMTADPRAVISRYSPDWNLTTGKGRCPFADCHKNGDARPSFSCNFDAQSGRWLWCCHAECRGSLVPRTGKHGGTLVDLLVLYHREVEEEALTRLESLCGVSEPVTETPSEVGGRSQADRLVELALEQGAELFHDERGEPHARVSMGDRTGIWPVKSRAVRRWLSSRFFAAERKVARPDALQAALATLEGLAVHTGPEFPLAVRVARDRATGGVWYDLGDGRAVHVVPGEWTVVDRPPVLFRHISHQQPQPEPVPGGSLDDLFRFINVEDPARRLLVLAYLITALVPDIPRPILIIHGPQGAAKSSTMRVLKSLLDPSGVGIVSPPDSIGEFIQQASHHQVLYLDNLDRLPRWLPDALCRACTGTGFSKRELYTDDDDVTYQFLRCVGLNGVNLVVTKPDVLDRSILLELGAIPEDRRLEERILWQEFEAIRPALLGALFTALAGTLAELPRVHLKRLPRMADFARHGAAAARALGRSESEFLNAYCGNIRAQQEEVFEASPLGQAVRLLMADQAQWAGTPTALFAELNRIAEREGVDVRSKAWPGSVHWLWRLLNPLRASLQAVGIEAVYDRSSAARTISLIRNDTEDGVIAVAGVTADEGDNPAGDDTAPGADAVVIASAAQIDERDGVTPMTKSEWVQD